MSTKNKGPRLFAGVYPCGIVYADRWHEVAGDYKRLAFLAYDTLTLDVERDCPADVAEEIRRDAGVIQRQAGSDFAISTCGQTVRLGSRATVIAPRHTPAGNIATH